MRPVLDVEHVHPAIHKKLGGDQSLLAEVQDAVGKYPVVVVGMRQNPVVKKARRLLVQRGVEFHYLEYGSYLSMWRARLGIKMWTGFQTFPQIFVAGTLIGGLSDLEKLLAEDNNALSSSTAS